MITFEELHQRAETIYILDKIDAITKEEKEFLVDQLRKDWDLPPMIREPDTDRISRELFCGSEITPKPVEAKPLGTTKSTRQVESFIG